MLAKKGIATLNCKDCGKIFHATVLAGQTSTCCTAPSVVVRQEKDNVGLYSISIINKPVKKL